MAYLRFAPQADNRRSKQATPPMGMVNCYLEATPLGAAKRSEWFVTSRPGRTRRADLGDVVRGLHAEPGCRAGNLFAPAGGTLNEVFSGWGFASAGVLAGGDVVKLVSYRDDLALKAFGQLKIYDGATLTLITDGDAPSFAGWLASVALRLVSFEENAVSFVWSEAGAPTAWPSDGEAATPDLSDPIVSVEEIGDNLWVFGARKIRPWQATGAAADADAFAKLTTEPIARGLAGPNASAPIGGGQRAFLGDNRVMHETRGLSVIPTPYRNLELALEPLSAAQIAAVNCWSYERQSKRFMGVSAGLEQCFVRDLDTGLWSEWTRYGMDVFDIDFAANAFGRTIVAGKASPYLWTLDANVYTDDGDPIVRQFTMHIPSGGDVPVDRFVIDIETVDVPLSGDGSNPVMQVEVSTDNGQNFVALEDVDLPHANNRFRPELWGLGLADAQAGMLIRCTITGPFGFSAWGGWINPTEEELTLA